MAVSELLARLRRSDDRAAVSPTTRYDLQLAAIPIAFLAAALAGTVLSVPLRGAMAAASVVGAAVLADGLFLNPPKVGGTR